MATPKWSWHWRRIDPDVERQDTDHFQAPELCPASGGGVSREGLDKGSPPSTGRRGVSRPRALLPGQYADGARVVETTLRPVRPACLIPEDDPGLAARFAESRSLAWGGHVGYALPYSRSEGLRQPWRRLLDLLDPDEVFALGTSRRPAVSPGIVNLHAPQQESAKPLADRIGDDLGRMVYTLEEGPERLIVSASALILGPPRSGRRP
jgi:hypothetical protein